MKKLFFLPVQIFILLLISCVNRPENEADTVLVNGKIWTVDDELPVAGSVAIQDGKIIAVGSNKKINRYIGSGTQVTDLKGKLALPGFNDNHTHFVDAGFNLMGVDLKDAATEAEFGERLAEASKKLPPGAWITGVLKAFLDGSLGSSTAMFFEPYTQDPSTSGLYVVDPDNLKQQMLEADKMGLQLAIHSIGDKSNSDLLDMFHEIIKKGKGKYEK